MIILNVKVFMADHSGYQRKIEHGVVPPPDSFIMVPLNEDPRDEMIPVEVVAELPTHHLGLNMVDLAGIPRHEEDEQRIIESLSWTLIKD